MEYIIKYYDEKRFLLALTEEEKCLLKNEIIDYYKEFIEDMKYINKPDHSFFTQVKDYISISLSIVNNAIIMLEEELEVSSSLYNKMKCELYSYIKMPIFEAFYNNEVGCYERIVKTVEIVLNKLRRTYFNNFLSKHKNTQYIIHINELCNYQLPLLRKNIKCILYNETNANVDDLKKDFGFGIYTLAEFNDLETLETKEPQEFSKKGKIVNYIKTHCQLKSNKEDSVYVDLGVLFQQENFFPNLSIINQYISNNVIKGANLYVTYPLFVKTNTAILKNNTYGEYSDFYNYSKFCRKMTEIIIGLQKDYNLLIIIKDAPNYHDYLQWKILIDIIAVKMKQKVKIAYVVENHDVTYDIEFYGNVENAIINIDEVGHLIEFDKPLDRSTYTKTFKKDLTEIRRFLRSIKVEPMVFSKTIKKEVFARKMVTAGFKSFIYYNRQFD